MLIYDIEIIKAIPSKNEPPEPDIEYCAGWHDHKGMGISCICAYDYATRRIRTFCEDNFVEFQELCHQRECLVGFNSKGFDNKVLAANGITINISKVYDILVEIWAGCGLGPVFDFRTHGGFGLDACCAANFGTGKTGNGALAPVDWQRGRIGSVIDYCINDVLETKKLLDLICEAGIIKNPKRAGIIQVRKPPIMQYHIPQIGTPPKEEKPKSAYIFTFGKHKGRSIEDVESSYLEWLVDQDWAPEKFEAAYKAAMAELQFRDRFPGEAPKREEDIPF